MGRAWKLLGKHRLSVRVIVYSQSTTRWSQALRPSVRPERRWRGSNPRQKGPCRADSKATVPPTPRKHRCNELNWTTLGRSPSQRSPFLKKIIAYQQEICKERGRDRRTNYSICQRRNKIMAVIIIC
ncbi:hypothetical protein PoB_002691300 [Plakobranchus ocellatus]|uniref:Uncharacterized protein n=1 Tax=Plakobranchus ocellatus TaxID=259542 RepID=A0AAV4A100_9GAST|nr:hypothetical protein PoB_002691300 [Plakobranchus ocellatus]